VSIREEFSRIPRANRFGLIILTLINMQDGFDLLAISFAANAISNDWGIARSELGWVFSAALFGMLFGATLLSPYADKYGRKTVTIIGLLLSGIGMAIAALSPSLEWLLVGRFITGVGVGAIITSLNTLAAEYAGEKLRSTMISIFQLGFPIGAIMAGYVCLWLLDIATWRHVFAFGAGLSFVFIPFVIWMPESEEYLKYKQGNHDIVGKGADGQILKKSGSISVLFTKTYRSRTILISLSFFLQLLVLYFLLSWTPKLVEDMGYSSADGNRAGRLINLVGMLGILVIGFIALRINITKTTVAFYLGLAVMLALVASMSPSLAVLTSLIAITGFFTHGAMIGLYSSVPSLYPVELRAAGSGWAIGISRLGAVFGPLIGGYLLGFGVSEQHLFYAFIPAALVAALCVALLYKETLRH